MVYTMILTERSVGTEKLLYCSLDYFEHSAKMCINSNQKELGTKLSKN